MERKGQSPGTLAKTPKPTRRMLPQKKRSKKQPNRSNGAKNPSKIKIEPYFG